MYQNLRWGVHARQLVQPYNCATVLLLEFHGADINQGATRTGGLQLEQYAAQADLGEPGQAGEQHQVLTSRSLADQAQVPDQTRDM